MTLVITQKEYKTLLRRQKKVERELDVVKKLVLRQDDESRINPIVLKRWERLSGEIDRGNGRVFASPKDARTWLKNL